MRLGPPRKWNTLAERTSRIVRPHARIVRQELISREFARVKSFRILCHLIRERKPRVARKAFQLNARAVISPRLLTKLEANRDSVRLRRVLRYLAKFLRAGGKFRHANTRPPFRHDVASPITAAARVSLFNSRRRGCTIYAGRMGRNRSLGSSASPPSAFHGFHAKTPRRLQFSSHNTTQNAISTQLRQSVAR